MKVLVCFSLVMLSLLLFVRCKSSEEVVKFKPYKFKDYVTKEIEVYEARECLYPLLDSIIMKTKECPMYQGLKIKMAFIYGVWSDSITQFGISAVYLSKYINHAKWTDAVFYYCGYDFYYGGNFYEPFFIKTHKTTTITCIIPMKYQCELHNMGDFEMEWQYAYRDGCITNVVYGNCNEKPGGLIINK